MAFKTAFIAHAPDGDAARDRCLIETPTYRLNVIVARDQEQAVAAARELAQTEGLHSILLCPGFTHKDIAEMQEAVGPEVGIFVARGDGPSGKIAADVMAREWGMR